MTFIVHDILWKSMKALQQLSLFEWTRQVLELWRSFTISKDDTIPGRFILSCPGWTQQKVR